MQESLIVVFLLYFSVLFEQTLQFNGLNLCGVTPPDFRVKCSLNNPCSPQNLLSCIGGVCCAKSLSCSQVLNQLSNKCEDVTIIGAGIGGTFSGWRLRNHGLRIGIYEYSDRVGGRMFTRQFAAAPDLNVDFGAMRVLPSSHRRMMLAAADLGLPLVDFPEGTGIPERTLYYFRQKHLRSSDLGGPFTPYNLRKKEYLSPDHLKHYLSSTLTNHTAQSAQNLRNLFNIVTRPDGIPLYQQSYKQASLKQISIEAYEYLKDVGSFFSLFGDAQATIELPFVPSNGSSQVLTIATGLDSYPKAFLRQFLLASPRHSYHPNKKLCQIKKDVNGIYNLVFTNTITVNGYTTETDQKTVVCSKKVILAIPKVPLQHIDWPPLHCATTSEALESVVDAPASKIFLLYDYPWWRQVPLNFRHTRSDLPNRQTYDFGVSSNGKAILLVSYADDVDVNFWRQLQHQGRSASYFNDRNKVTTEVIRHAHMHLSEIYDINCHDIPPARDGLMMTWDEYPFNGAWSVWKPGYNWLDIKNHLTKVSDQDFVYIVHGHYGAAYNGWGEGSLEAADMVLQNFGLAPYASFEYM